MCEMGNLGPLLTQQTRGHGPGNTVMQQPVYPPQQPWNPQGGYPPPQPGYGPQGNYPPQGGYPPPGGYSPQGGYPPPGYPPPGGYPPPQGYPPPGYQQQYGQGTRGPGQQSMSPAQAGICGACTACLMCMLCSCCPASMQMPHGGSDDDGEHYEDDQSAGTGGED